jgi:hypothetical protein
MRGRVAKNAFNAGELSRRMEGRSDLDGIYDRAVAKMLNYVPALEGPAMKRPGFRFIKPRRQALLGHAGSSSTRQQSYVLEWGD